MAKQHTDEKGYFSSSWALRRQRCHRSGSDKWHFSGKRVGFLKSVKKKKNAVIRGKIQTENIVKRGTFCGEHSEKGTCF